MGKFANKDLLFVHPWYNESWVDDKGMEYFKLFRGVNHLDIMWIGYDVVAPLSYDANEDFIEKACQKPYLWFNWPVNDYKRAEIFMEAFEFYDSPDFNFDAFYLNPMNQAELSKIAIYQTNEFLKNPASYNPIEAFKSALVYVEEPCADDLFIIADSFFGSKVYERFQNKKYFEDMKIAKAFKDKDIPTMINLVDEKISALESYEKNHSNQKLYNETKPFFSSLYNLLLAIKSASDGDFGKAEDFYTNSADYKVKIYKEHTKDTVEK